MANVFAVIVTNHPIYPDSEHDKNGYQINLFSTMQLAQQFGQRYQRAMLQSVEIEQLTIDDVNTTINI